MVWKKKILGLLDKKKEWEKEIKEKKEELKRIRKELQKLKVNDNLEMEISKEEWYI